ncbi:response regulator [Marinitoga lauensis]|uniref:response regulator n=1 Tax=Marinitoga lauensis TaxID=2201189 RepID=UPI00101122B1|nr:response regulator [Marinitoga lauensis]
MSRILIVEDNALIRNEIKKILINLGHTIVGEIDDGSEVLEKFAFLNPDIVTLDLALKKINGMIALKALKRKFPNSKVIIISVTNNKKDIFNALQLGADYFIIKPLTQEKMKKALNKVINSGIKISKIRSLYKKTDERENFVDIINDNGVLRIRIKKKLNGRTIEKLNNIIDSLLIIKPLKIVFSYFDENEKKEIIKKSLNDIVVKIKNAGGTCTIE